jgi:deoxyribodipyrimidine photolyase-related protein
VKTVLVFGDQLNRSIGALADADPNDTRILMVESEALLGIGRHVQRNHLVITAMRRLASELRDFEVDQRRAPTLRAGIEAHIDDHRPEAVIATEPNSRRARDLCDELDIEQVRSNQFLCHHRDFAAWADARNHLRMEDFYRWTRARLGYLMDGGEPVGGTWNLDAENRQPPPDDPSIFTAPPRSTLDDLDRDVLDSLPASHGEAPVGLWATTRGSALARLRHFVDHELHRFGPYEDAMTSGSWSLAHSVLSPYLNLGLLLPGEVCDAVEDKYRAGEVPLNSAEGFIRQVIGWREYVWGLYWLWPAHADSNALDHRRQLPPAFTGDANTEMHCLADTLAGLRERAWVHHIPRLMILSNLANLYGIHPRRVMDWMTDNYIDGAEWVMVPNVMGMGLWADGGRMATKPYVSGGAYINRMSDYCGDCRYDPKQRIGEDACPFTTLYWDFLARHAGRLRGNHRMARPLANMSRLGDLDEVRARAETVVRGLRAGRI